MVHKVGYGNWEELKTAFKTSPLFSFDWYVKSRSGQELGRRCETLVRLIEKENQEYDERERRARKEKKLATVRTFRTHCFIVLLMVRNCDGTVSDGPLYKFFSEWNTFKASFG